MNDREPTITRIKAKLADLNQKIAIYKTQRDAYYTNTSGMVSPFASNINGNENENDNENDNENANSNNPDSCGSDGTINILSMDCLNDLWSNAGCTIPMPPLPESGVYPLPGTSYSFDVSNNYLDMSKLTGMDLNTFNNTLIPQIIASAPSTCGSAVSLAAMNADILSEINDINTMLNNSFQKQTDNINFKNVTVSPLLNQLNQLQSTYAELSGELAKPIQLEGNYEMTQLKSSSNFSQYLMYLILMIFILGCLIFIFKNPEVGNVDMFILVLAGIILVYYIYDYIVTKKRKN